MPRASVFNYALNPDSETLKQFKECYSKSFVSSAALMPDAHSGYVAPIGAVLATKDFIVPARVGFDVGCGLIALILTSKNKNFYEDVLEDSEAIYKEVMKKVPMGKGDSNSNRASKETWDVLGRLIEEFKKSVHSKEALNLVNTMSSKFIGTLGAGNHFIEIGKYKKELWLIIHSGSRGLGYKLAEKYMKSASASKSDFEKTFPLKVDSKEGKEYLNVLDFLLNYALLNRMEIANRVVSAMESVLGYSIEKKLWANKNHNHVILENGFYVHRKGATPAKKGERGIIPANMRDGCYLVKGLGNPKFLYSSSHGAGRQLSRTGAKSSISLSAFKESMKGIRGTISESTIDEAPQAYKPIDEVMDKQKESVVPVKKILPVINWKG